MKKKINRRFVGIALFSILITLLSITAFFYSRLKAQVFSDLKIMAELLPYNEKYGKLPEDIRVTIVDGDGTVRYDSAADAGKLENHLERPEIKDALESGEGQDVRRSDTLSENIFYYALRLENGQILRIGKESASVEWLFVSAIPILFLMVLMLAAVCMAVSRYLTEAIIAPIDAMVENMEHAEENEIYEELIPVMRKIRAQHEEILAAANMRQEFTANVTHELKTPLTAISGYAELMESGVAKEKDIRHFSHEIAAGASRLLTLIDDILKLSKLDGGNYEDVMEITDLAHIARNTVDTLSVNASKMNVSVLYKGCRSAKIRIGEELAEELAYNLIENAIRYNRPGGKVEVDVTVKDNTVCFTVSDTGIGIPKKHRKRVFERFYRVDKSRSKELGGTGLGLAIVKHICGLTKGEISLDSREGEGTRVRIIWDSTKGGAEDS